ncbi:MAG: response regulator transcription factor [Kordiimonadaceae bacterium]|nr:response regulator transcription factor [Kordiimonadaceae bacterium]MBO6570263.1 response regulator transcription factor [Kordiimonadaceae bacterium]MBO6965639.1 response regulator transcription factor [Kordiimonadaceae bacterium]
MKILLVEDEPIAAARLKNLVETVRSDASVDAIEGTAEGAAKRIMEHNFDLIFMDIQLADGLCFDIFEAVDPPCPVIFCTAFDDYAIQAFKANGIEYLLKPVRDQDITRAFERYDGLKKQLSGQTVKPSRDVVNSIDSSGPAKQRFLIRAGNRLFSINVDEVAWFETRGRDIALHTFDGRDFYIDDTLNELERKLETSAFFRINRQRLVAFDAIEDIRIDEGRYQLKLAADPSPVLVSRDRVTDFRQWLDR